MKLLISEDKVKNLIFDIYCRLHEGWVSAKELDYKSILEKNELPVTGTIGQKCLSWLQDNHYVEFKNGGRAGNRFRWPLEVNDISSVSDGFIAYLKNDKSTKPIKLTSTGRIKPTRFEPGDKVFLLQGSIIVEMMIKSVSYGIGIQTTYDLINNTGVYQYHHDDLFVSVEDLLNQLRSNVKFLKSDNTK